MTRIRRLAVATDLSAPARHAAERAALFAKEQGAALDLLHVVTTGPIDKLRRLMANFPAQVEQRLIDSMREEVRLMAEGLLNHYGIAAGVHVASGAVVQRLNEWVDALEADLVVLGARGAGFMRHLLLGSTAERMLSRIFRPMLVVKQPPHEKYRKLLVPVDFSPASLPALRIARAIAPDAAIVLLHAFDVPFEGKLRLAGVEESMINHYRVAAREEALEKMRQLAGEAGIPSGAMTMLVLHGDAWRHILEQEQEQDCDLIVMGKHGEDGIEKFLLGSVARHVLGDSQGDVLVSV